MHRLHALPAALALVAALLLAPARAGRFWVITDIHVSEDYAVGSSPPTFCTKHVFGTGDAGQFGTFNCDSPYTSLLTSALDFVAASSARLRRCHATWALFLGDSPTLYAEHPAHAETDEMIQRGVDHVASLLEERVVRGAGVRVYPALGNHDRHPSTAVPPPETPQGAQYLRRMAGAWRRLGLSEESIESVLHGGYYTELVEDRVRLVVVNTNYWASSNPWALNTTGTSDFVFSGDLGGQWAWLRRVLAEARKAGERVVLAGHIPPGINVLNRKAYYVPSAELEYARVAEEFADVLAIALFGHLHRDCVHLVRRDAGAGPVVGSAVVVPSLSPRMASTPPGSGQTEGKHPAVRLFSYKSHGRRGLRVTDWTQYWANLTEGNARGSLAWGPSYSAAKEYGLRRFAASDMERFVQGLTTSREQWCRFERHWFVERWWPQCDLQCRARALCSFLYASDSGYKGCLTNATAPSYVCDRD
eukprot:m51a1_g10263 hypothetical protein (475) ;mRNA; r:11674-13732